MKHALLGIALLFLSARHAHADTGACLAQPTQDCLFELALQQADDKRELWQIAEGYLAVAYLQEQELNAGAESTRAALRSRLVHEGSDPAADAEALQKARSYLTISEIPVGRLPDTDQWFITTLTDLNLQAGLRAPDASKYQLSAAVVASIREKTNAMSADVLGKFALLSHLRGPELPRAYAPQLSLRDDLSMEQIHTLSILFAKGVMTGARQDIDRWTDPNQHASGLAALALALAQAGEVAEALNIASLPALRDQDSLKMTARFDLIKVWAIAGKEAETTALINALGVTIGGPPDLPVVREARMIVAMVSGDMGKLQDILASSDVSDLYFGLEKAIDAVMPQRLAQVEALIRVLPADLKEAALVGLAKAQIRIGDIAAAQSTIDRLKGLTMTSGFQTGGLTSELAPLLAALGHEDEAAWLVAKKGWPELTALVAARLE